MGGVPLSLSASSSAASGLDQRGGMFDLRFGTGAWNVNLGGSGTALQSASALPAWAVPALLVLGVLWIATRGR